MEITSQFQTGERNIPHAFNVSERLHAQMAQPSSFQVHNEFPPNKLLFAIYAVQWDAIKYADIGAQEQLKRLEKAVISTNFRSFSSSLQQEIVDKYYLEQFRHGLAASSSRRETQQEPKGFLLTGQEAELFSWMQAWIGKPVEIQRHGLYIPSLGTILVNAADEEKT